MQADLQRLAHRVRRLGHVTLRRGVEAAAVERDEIADALYQLATTTSTTPTAPTSWRAAEPPPAPNRDERVEKRLRAMLAHRTHELEKLQRLLATATRPRRRSRPRAEHPELPFP